MIIEGAERALHAAPFLAVTPRDVAVLTAWIVVGSIASQRFSVAVRQLAWRLRGRPR